LNEGPFLSTSKKVLWLNQNVWRIDNISSTFGSPLSCVGQVWLQIQWQAQERFVGGKLTTVKLDQDPQLLGPGQVVPSRGSSSPETSDDEDQNNEDADSNSAWIHSKISSSALEFLHRENNLCHDDFKLDNIFVASPEHPPPPRGGCSLTSATPASRTTPTTFRHCGRRIHHSFATVG